MHDCANIRIAIFTDALAAITATRSNNACAARPTSRSSGTPTRIFNATRTWASSRSGETEHTLPDFFVKDLSDCVTDVKPYLSLFSACLCRRGMTSRLEAVESYRVQSAPLPSLWRGWFNISKFINPAWHLIVRFLCHLIGCTLPSSIIFRQY